MLAAIIIYVLTCWGSRSMKRVFCQRNQRRRLLRFPPPNRLTILFAAFLLLLAVPGNAAEQKNAEAQKPSVPPPAVIPVAEIATQATEVSNLLRGFATNLAPGTAVETIRKNLPEVSANNDLELASTTNILKEQPSLETLQAQEQLWEQKQQQLTAWLNVLTERATRLQNALNLLKTQQDRWARTRDAEQSPNVPAPILSQIDTTLAAIEAAQTPLHAQRNDLLDLQSKIAQQVARCGTVLAQIGQVQESIVGGILSRDGSNIWHPDLWARAKASFDGRVSKILATYRADFLRYLSDPAMRMPLHVGLFIVLSLVFLAAGRQFKQWAASGEGAMRATIVFDHPLAAALLITLMVATGHSSPLPSTLKQLFDAIGLVPMIILARPFVHPSIAPAMYILAVLFALDTVRHAFAGVPPAGGQALIMLESLAGIVVLRWLMTYGPQSRVSGENAGLRWHNVRRFIAGMLLLILAGGFLASAFGYWRLARLMTPGVLVGGVFVLWGYTLVQLASGIIAYALRVWPLRLLQMVRHHRELLDARIYRLLLWLIIGALFVRYLDYLGLLDPAMALASDLLTTRLERGSISTSVGDIAAFFLTLLGAYWLSSFIRFMLEEDVYPRTRIAAGQSYAVSNLLNYSILALGFLVALGVLGLDLNKMTVLLGAFGVGIGFGLQSVVNNFVSGLILLFERPIHVGDMVQVGNSQGRVRRIGIRASVVRTAQGAEIIVPNAQLITQDVTNWTLSDRLRRIDLPVAVIAGAAPKKVIELIEAVARVHPKVLQDPAPRCLFMSYGDSSINFELRAWTEYTNSVQVHSDLTVAIYEAVNAAGMSFPFPQREVRLLSDYDGESTNKSVKAADKKT
jgi:potassium-dependent mechanosensitive channel